MCSLLCLVFIVQSAGCGELVQCELVSLQCAVFSVFSVPFAVSGVCSVQCKVFCTVCIFKWEVNLCSVW